MKIIKTIAVIIIALFAIVFIYYCTKVENDKKSTTVRIGWQIPLATQGQIVQVLKKTDLLEKNELKGEFVSFSYGGPQSEAALAGEIDVIFVGDQPAVNLIAKGGKWKIVSRLFYTKTAIMVPINSDIKSMSDFKRKTIASPFGSVAHREAILKEQAVGFNTEKDVNNTNLDILEISSVVQAGGDKKWGNIDGVGVWEPSTSLFERNKLARIVDYTKTLGVIAVSEEFINKHPKDVVRLLESVLEAWNYFAVNQKKVNQWYIEDARISYKNNILVSASFIDPNINSKNINDVDLVLTDENIQTLEIAAKWSYERGYSMKFINISSSIDQSYLKKAIENIQKDRFDVKQVGVK